MNDKELFAAVIDSVVRRYNLELRKPYPGCEYFEIYQNGQLLGGMNPEGYSLLYNCKQLAEACENLIR